MPLGGGRVFQCSGAAIINGQVFLGGHEQLGSLFSVLLVATVVSFFSLRTMGLQLYLSEEEKSFILLLE